MIVVADQRHTSSGVKNLTPDLPDRVTGLDGKSYPARRRDRDSFAGHAHYMAHEEHLSVRGIVAAFAEVGHRVSVGAVHSWLTEWQCVACPVQVGRSGAPEHPGAGERRG